MIHLYIFSMYKRYLERSSCFLSSVYNVKLSWPRLLSLQWHPVYHVVHYMVNGLPFVDWSNKLFSGFSSQITSRLVFLRSRRTSYSFSCKPQKNIDLYVYFFFIKMVFNNKRCRMKWVITSQLLVDERNIFLFKQI